MLGRYTLANNVKVTLAADVSAVASSITVNAASGLFHDPPDPTGDDASNGTSILTIQDDALPPTKTEIITYTGVTDNGNGTLTLTGVLRGIENTIARSWTTGAVLFQAGTSGQFSDPDLTVDRTPGGVITAHRPLKVVGELDADSIATGDWQAITLAEFWINHGYGDPAPQYRKDPNGIVYLRGGIRNTLSGGDAETAFTLPAGCRPEGAAVYTVSPSGGSYAAMTFRIGADGVSGPEGLIGEPYSIWLDGIFFLSA